ncbi:MAG: hypothetical protein JW709_05665, partial [Sedimentisphaerales bacterium]|nr:hypothetical protein [Sedimentisphaerales bacterium]
MDAKRIIGVLCVLMVSAYATAATTINNQSQLWEGVVVNTDADTLAYNNVSADYTWTLNEDEFGNPADVTWGDVNDSYGRCPLGYASSAVVTISVTIQTTEGAPGVLNYIGDSNYSIRLGHVN